MGDQGLGDGVADAKAGVEARERILKNHLRAQAHVDEVASAKSAHVPPFDADVPRDGLHQAKDGAPGRGLAAARLADERQRLAAHQVEGNVLDRVDPRPRAPEKAARDLEPRDKVAHLQHGRPAGRCLERRAVVRRDLAGLQRDDRKARRAVAAAHRAEARHGRQQGAGIGLEPGARRSPRSAPSRPSGSGRAPACGPRPARRRPCRA